MTLYMRDLENQEIGFEQGFKEGYEQRDSEVIEIMLKKGLSPEEVSDFANYPIDLVKSVQKNLLETQ
mgnify:FL=1